MTPEYAGTLSGTITYNGIVEILGGTVSNNTTWKALTGITTYRLAGNVTVRSSSVLTVASTLTVDGGHYLNVGTDGTAGTFNANAWRWLSTRSPVGADGGARSTTATCWRT